jgi:ubiquinone/menaquinone biosynthesis C-methylase UbiE
MKKYLKLFLPPVFSIFIKKIYYFYLLKKNSSILSKNVQDIKIYDKKITADILEAWGNNSVWNEILMILNKKEGNILDVACGTGVNMIELQKVNPKAVFYGCDISENLISLAKKKGIKKNLLQCIDATKMNYKKKFFSYSYSIGSLEHFIEKDIKEVIKKLSLNTSVASFHFMPVSRKNKNEGWIKTYQTFHNNSVNWWLNKFNREFKKVEVIDSSWNDFISVGKWFLCFK